MRVLIAHASEVSRSKLADTVTRGRRLPLDILSVDNGPDALDLLLADDPPEVALVDWDLPGIEAPEMCRLVRDFHHHHDSWIIVLTPPVHREAAGEVVEGRRGRLRLHAGPGQAPERPRDQGTLRDGAADP